MAAQDGTPSLGALGASRGILFGTAADSDVLAPSAFSDLYVRQARIFTSNNFLKFRSLRPAETSADFTLADSLAEFARNNCFIACCLLARLFKGRAGEKKGPRGSAHALHVLADPERVILR